MWLSLPLEECGETRCHKRGGCLLPLKVGMVDVGRCSSDGGYMDLLQARPCPGRNSDVVRRCGHDVWPALVFVHRNLKRVLSFQNGQGKLGSAGFSSNYCAAQAVNDLAGRQRQGSPPHCKCYKAFGGHTCGWGGAQRWSALAQPGAAACIVVHEVAAFTWPACWPWQLLSNWASTLSCVVVQ